MTDLPKIDWMTAEGDPTFAYTLCPDEQVNAFSFQVQRGYHQGKRTTDAQRAQITRRLLASWNACIDEDVATLEFMAKEGATVRKQRDELLSLSEAYQRQLNRTEQRLNAMMAAVDHLDQFMQSISNYPDTPGEAVTVGKLVEEIRDAAAKARRGA